MAHPHRLPSPLLALAGCAALACATAAPPVKMGVASDLSRVVGKAEFCAHQVPEQVCTRHHPELIPRFKAVNDWCPPHEVPESQCLICHPDLTFEALPTLREGADLAILAKAGEDVGDLVTHLVPGKVTVFDFYADWCVSCREIDLHAYKLLNQHADLAVRKLNIVDWDSPLAKQHLARVAGLPFVVVYGKDGQRVRSIEGVKLEELTRAIEEGASR